METSCLKFAAQSRQLGFRKLEKASQPNASRTFMSRPLLDFNLGREELNCSAPGAETAAPVGQTIALQLSSFLVGARLLHVVDFDDPLLTAAVTSLLQPPSLQR